MGLLARILKTETGEDNEILQTVEAHYGESKYCDQFSSSGDDAPPLEEDRVALLDLEGTGNFCSVGVLVKSQGAKPGEKIIYSRDKSGKVTAKIYLQNDGSISIETEKPVSIDGKKIVIKGGGAAAARVGDSVQASIPAGAVVVGVSGGEPVMNPAPIVLSGSIVSGSANVEIG